MLSRVLKYGLYGSLAYGGCTLALNFEEVQSLAIVRLLRTTTTAVEIGRTYQSMLYSREWDRKSKEYYDIKSEAHKIGAEKLLELCRANKGVYIKIGQHIGALDYLLPSEYVEKMRILHKDAPKNEVKQLYQVIREDLKKDPEEIFETFESEPLGTASLAQVHKATLKDGTEVAVKVQHYFVRKSINIDLKVIEMVVNVMSKVFPDFEMEWLVDETKRNIAKELNFLSEGHNAEKVSEMFKDYKWLKVPKIFWDYSTERVLVMEYVSGGQVNNVQYIEERKIDRSDLCRKLGDLYSNMIFVNGFVHSDPHPGNILVAKEEGAKDTTVYLLDHGLYAELTNDFRFNYSKLWLSIISRDKNEMQKYSEILGIRKELYFLFACMVTGRPWESIMKGIEKTKPNTEEKNLFQNELPNFLAQLTECLQHMDRQTLLVLKTNDLIRSIEYALKMQEQMCGFQVMTQCCLKSIYLHDYKHASALGQPFLSLKYMWTTLVFYFYGIYIGLVGRS